ncbi:cdc1-like protein [Drechmeria coniospora]|uniref:Cdc1-like protein n=1 Tax=Drechmeria coniospora TaxID=98403 RepID=A0A151GKC5_DRECN|nr:cdc1-like protein [Drechmeria coniospora]KYK57546.1 cdc1-like protein [Drechmeria coniospora]
MALRRARLLWAWASGPGRQLVMVGALTMLHQVRRNLTARRIFSVPHALVLLWMVILLWGERWVFESKVEDCRWQNWEKWPKGTRPHHLIFVADPQLIDPHSYPSRPWPLGPLTMLITDNYLRRSYNALQRELKPDSLFFLGDLFDGGREWKTRKGRFVDPKWGNSRTKEEQKLVEKWHRKYGDDYWMREYQRFGDIFFNKWYLGGAAPGPWQKGRKLVASLPGNHDLGFGAQVQIPVRDRFSAFFGDGNRVDIVGNHTIVSVDTVSMSAGTSAQKAMHNLQPIHGPVDEFLEGVQATKRKMVQDELRTWHDVDRDYLLFGHKVEELASASTERVLRDPGPRAADFPTILLTHVPLYRSPGTPCGPLREHWPPTKAAKGQSNDPAPDHRNAITVSAGYQYQNVLSEEDSKRLVKSVGNVVHVFSGDDHDYCELTHSSSKDNVREITVKSFSMAMGVPTPGFVMVSLHNPVDADGRPMPGSPEKTLQTHLCLLPNQTRTFLQYATYAILSLVLLSIWAFLIPILRLQPFALEAEKHRPLGLPMFKDKDKAKSEPPDHSAHVDLPLRMYAVATSAVRSSSAGPTEGARWSSKKSRQTRRWGWGGGVEGPRINLDDAFSYDSSSDKAWRRRRGRRTLRALGRELWTTAWRVAWMSVLIWAYLAKQG